ncbi:MAG: DegT/DnrJ/EryC1/StrS family aminotransferase [Bryobacterales bacterium]|nr:DegT/DnrJ/EryC1/StrS family aminotransferase [Bryobacterales bacterium]
MTKLAILGGEPVRRKPFSPWPQFTERDRARLLEVLESRNWGGYPFPNRYASEFAQKFADYHGAKYGCTLVNGTVAIVVALQAAGVKFGDEVIVPAYTWDGTATAVLFAGAIPVFADIDPDTYCMSVESARQAITPRTKALLPVHLAMRFADMDPLLDLAREKDLLVIEDCAHVHGGAYKGRGAGSMGDAGTFSMQSSKLMTAGEGGIVLTSRLDMFETIQSYVNCGRASMTDQFKRRVIGSNYRLTEFQAAVLLGQLETLPELAAARVAMGAKLSAALAALPNVRPLPPQTALTREPIYNYIFQYRPGNSKVSRDMFAAALDAEGIPCDGRFYEPVYRSDLFQVKREDFPQLDRDLRKASCPVSERAAYEESIWLPQFELLGGEGDIADVIGAVEKVAVNLAQLEDADPKLAALKSMSRAERPRIEKKNY